MQKACKKHALGGSYSEPPNSLEKKTPPQIRISAYDDDPFVDAILEQYSFCHILLKVKQMGNLLAKVAHLDVLDLDLEDIAEDVHIHFWQKSKVEPIRHAEAYLAQMIRNKCIDEWRKRQRLTYPQLLSMMEYEDTLERHCLIEPSEGMDDPSLEIEEQLTLEWRIGEAVEGIVELPPRQQLSMLCSLQEQADNYFSARITKALQVQGVNVNVRWPKNQDEKQLLMASLYPARLAIAKRLDIDLSLYKQKKRVQRRCA